MKFLQHCASATPKPSSAVITVTTACTGLDAPPQLRWVRVPTADKDKASHVCLDPYTRQCCAVLLSRSCVVELWDVGTLPHLMARLALPPPLLLGEHQCVGLAWSWCRGFLCGAFLHRATTLVATWDVARGDLVSLLKYVVLFACAFPFLSPTHFSSPRTLSYSYTYFLSLLPLTRCGRLPFAVASVAWLPGLPASRNVRAGQLVVFGTFAADADAGGDAGASPPHALMDVRSGEYVWLPSDAHAWMAASLPRLPGHQVGALAATYTTSCSPLTSHFIASLLHNTGHSFWHWKRRGGQQCSGIAAGRAGVGPVVGDEIE